MKVPLNPERVLLITIGAVVFIPTILIANWFLMRFLFHVITAP